MSDSGNTVSTSSEDETTPMVAFLCGKPAMHLTPRGWVKDENTDCLKDPVKILEYCKQVRVRVRVEGVREAGLALVCLDLLKQ